MVLIRPTRDGSAMLPSGRMVPETGARVAWSLMLERQRRAGSLTVEPLEALSETDTDAKAAKPKRMTKEG
jgi:hypothetical protein